MTTSHETMEVKDLSGEENPFRAEVFRDVCAPGTSIKVLLRSIEANLFAIENEGRTILSVQQLAEYSETDVYPLTKNAGSHITTLTIQQLAEYPVETRYPNTENAGNHICSHMIISRKIE